MEHDGEVVILREKFGLEPYIRRYMDSESYYGLPLCPEAWAGNRIPEPLQDQALQDLEADCRYGEEAFLTGDLEYGLQTTEGLRLRCSDRTEGVLEDYPPGVYLHALRRLAMGDSAGAVHDDLRRVEAGQAEPVPYIEMLRRKLGEYLEAGIAAPAAREAKPSSDPKVSACPSWETRDAWLLVGDPVEGEGYLAWDGKMIREVPPQVYRLLFQLRGKRASLSIGEAIDLKLIRPKSSSAAPTTFKKLVSRASKLFYELGAGEEERPLAIEQDVCRSLVEIVHRREARDALD